MNMISVFMFLLAIFQVFSPPRTSLSLSDNAESSQTSPSAAGPSQVGSTTAEQKRRTHIKNGFETLQTLVPALANNPNNKVSRPALLVLRVNI